jgi:glycine cleavage system regulatory protein
MQHIVFTFVGNDRPGLVQCLSERISEHGGNWLASRLARLAGKFAGIVSVSVAEGNVAALNAALEQLADDGLAVIVERSDAQSKETGRLCLIIVLGNDRPGIVHEVASALAARQINIEELASKVESAPMAGIPLFSAHIDVAIPAALDLTELQDQLDDIAEQLDLEISLDISLDQKKSG